jgi:hypothetical protein
MSLLGTTRRANELLLPIAVAAAEDIPSQGRWAHATERRAIVEERIEILRKPLMFTTALVLGHNAGGS